MRENKNLRGYSLAYLPGAWALTDPPKNFGELIAQRRRWTNGSTMIFFYIFSKWENFFSTTHYNFQKIAFLINFGTSIV
jgi:cellulose synthase/poly-beta-1,6-N-acetylglucosamine synthase-like glycosyltransferase